MVGSYTTYGNSLRAGISKIVSDTAEQIINDTIDSFKARKTGKAYSTLPNVSSAPGETPAYQSGDLARSIRKTMHVNAFGAEAEIVVGADYGKYLVGKGRPVLSPAVSRHRATLKNGILKLSSALSGDIF